MKALVVAHNTFREATRDRLLVGFVAAGALLLAGTRLLSPLALGEGRRLTVDLGLSGISFLGLLVVLLVGTSLVAKELERRTIYNLLSRPIARASYLLGKWIGLSGALWIFAAVLGLGLGIVVVAGGDHGLAGGIAQATYLAALELTIMTALAVLFSALSTPVLSALYTLGFYLVGQWSYDLRGFALQLAPAPRAALELAANIVPNLPLFNIRARAAGGHLAGSEHLAVATAYAVLYVGCVLALAAAAFESRDFK